MSYWNDAPTSGWEGFGSPEWQAKQEALLNAGTTAAPGTGPWGVISSPAPAPAPYYAPPAPAPAPAPAATGKPSAQQIAAFFEANKQNPAAIVQAMNQNGVTVPDLLAATGYSQQDALSYMQWAGITPTANGFQIQQPAAAGASQNLTPETMQKLQEAGYGNWTDPTTGRLYVPMYNQAQGENSENGPIEGYYSYAPGKSAVGDPFTQYDAQGNFARDAKFKEVDDTWMKLAIAAITGGAAAGLFGGTLGVPASSSAAAAGGGAAGGAGGFIGEGALSGIPAWDAALANAGGAAAAAGATAGGFVGEGALSGIPAWDAALASAVPASLVPGLTQLASQLGTSLPNLVKSLPSIPGLSNLLNSGASTKSILDLISTAAPYVAQLAGGAIAANAADKAADTQVQATKDSNALLKYFYDDSKALNKPFYETGVKGINRLADVMGISGNTSATGYGALTKPFEFEADPGYQFRLSEGEKGLGRAAAAKGLYFSGGAAKDLMRFNQGLASQEYGAAHDRWNTDQTTQFNRLASLAGVGQTAAGANQQAGTNYGGAMSGNILSAGSAASAGQMGRSNAMVDALSQGVSMYQQNELLSRLRGV